MTDKSLNKIPTQVIIVEGRSDTARLIETFGPEVKIIETGGSALNHATRKRIKQAADQFGIIIFTDPDFQGLRLRRIISEAIPGAKQAHLSPDQSRGNKIGASLGVEHATPDAIRTAIAAVTDLTLTDAVERIPLADLVRLQLIGHPSAVSRRAKVAKQFHLGHLNGKQLQKQLSLYQITLDELTEFLNETDHLDKEEANK